MFQLCGYAHHSMEAEKHWRRNHLANSRCFNLFVGLAVMVNAGVLGAEVDRGRGEGISGRAGFFVSECGFTLFFFAEMVIRMNLDGWLYFCDMWNLLDYHLVVLSFVDTIMSIILNTSGDLVILNAFRIVRMLRLVRSIRLLRMFQELWVIVKSMYEIV